MPHENVENDMIPTSFFSPATSQTRGPPRSFWIKVKDKVASVVMWETNKSWGGGGLCMDLGLSVTHRSCPLLGPVQHRFNIDSYARGR